MTADATLIAAASALLAIALAALAVSRAWQGWLDLRRQQLMSGAPGTGIDLAELKRRVRKLEAIASGTD